MTYSIIRTGESRSFPVPHPFTDGAVDQGESLVILGGNPGGAFRELTVLETKRAILIELGTECLGVHTGEDSGREGSNVVGFARFRLGDADPTNLIELVKQPNTDPTAVSTAKDLFEQAGLKVAICNDFPGRIVDRLIRPYFNAVLRRLDEGLATAEALDMTLRLGLGYPEGPIGLLHRTGLAQHFEVTRALYEALADPAYAPARRARVAWERSITRE